MTPSPTVESIFFAALEKPQPAERSAYLDDACQGDSELRRRVERLLEAHSQVGPFMQSPVAENLVDEAVGSGDHISEANPRRIQEKAGETLVPNAGNEKADVVPNFLSPSEKSGVLGRLDHYEILEVVGHGGMGIVLKGLDEKLQRVVAIKVLAPELAASGTARQRFTREARAAAAVSHDHVVTIHAVDDDHRPPYLVMQFIDGVSLQTKLDQAGPLGLKEILRIGLQTASGLAAAHRQGLVHRDIKPANILLENRVERVKITDFGLARAVDDASLTQSGAVAGTPLYMSPEQAAGEPLDHRSDLFSLGSVLYAMCTGRPPFRASGTHAVIKRVIEDAPRPITESNHEIPTWLCDLIARLHGKNPADRFQSAQEVADLLGQHLAHLQQPGKVAMPQAVEKLPSSKPVRTHWWAACLALLGLGGMLFVAYHSWQSRSAGPSHSQNADSNPDLVTNASDKEKAQPIAAKAVAKEVLDELSRLVTIQKQNLEIVRMNYVVERVSRLDVCAAEGLLTEAYIKLATAEQKPVIDLLDDLVRCREEELIVIETRFQLGATGDAEVLLAKGRLSEARARQAAARAEAPQTKSFVVPRNKGRTEAAFASLAEAVAAARNGDSIEIHRNGSILVDPIKVPVGLTIRPAEGYRPVIKLSPEGVASNGAILDTNSPLIIEGLEFHRLGSESKMRETPTLIRTHQAPLHVAHCRFVVKGESNTLQVTCPADVIARNCEFEGASGAYSSIGFSHANQSEIRIEQCRFGDGAFTIDTGESPEAITLTIVNNTANVSGPFIVLSQVSAKTNLAALSTKSIRFHASGNLIFDRHPVLRATANGQMIKVADAENLLRGIVRLDPGRSGKGAGHGGTDVGAELSLLGPGEAYRNWIKTPDYLEWRKKTDDLMKAKGG